MNVTYCTAALLSLFVQPASAYPVLEREVLAELNRARADPAAYTRALRDYRARFNGKLVRYPGNPSGLLTREGVAAVDSAITDLRGLDPLPPFVAVPLLHQVARDHVTEQGPRGAIGHESANGDRVRHRLRKRGGGDQVNEIITYGPPSAVEVVRQFVVDDGVPGRGHRRAVFAVEWRYAGVACGPHRRYRTMCVVTLARDAEGRE